VPKDAAAALIATIRKPEINSTTLVRGNQPIAEGPREKLLQSGFFSHVHSVQPIVDVKGRISEKQSKKVEPQTARGRENSARVS